MSEQITKDVKKQREHKIIKANEFIQNSRFNLSMQEQKIILYLISKIKPDDTEIKGQPFNIKEFCQICGIDSDSGKNYYDLKQAIQSLHDKSLWIKIDEKTEILFSWINSAAIIKDDGVVQITLNPQMKPYLLQLREKFTQYEFVYTLAMKSQYSVRIYELLKSYENIHRKIFDINELKKKLMCEKESYENFNNFKKYVLDIAMREINNLTDISVEYEATKQGRKFTQIEFIIKSKKDTVERLKAISKIEKLLD